MTVTELERARANKRWLASFVSAGWGMPTKGALELAGGPVVYLCDIESGRLFVVSLTVDAIPQLKKKAQEAGASFAEACNALGALLGELANGGVRLNREASQLLAVAAGLYIAGTKSYSMMKEAGVSNPQIVVLRHPDASSGAHLLRPFPTMATTPLSPSDIEKAASDVLRVDRQNHPERFPRAKVLQFTCKDVVMTATGNE